MKGSIFAAAALVGSAMADGVHRRHDAFHQRREASASVWSSSVPAAEETCGCTTKVITYYGDATLVPSTSTLTSTVHSTSTSTLTVTVSGASSAPPSSAPVASSTAVASTPAVELPTPGVSTFSTTGVYTIPATTITVHDTTTVCGATSTEVPSGTHTYGGVTTVVETATTVTCPYATVKPSGSTVTSVIETTTYVCPTAAPFWSTPPPHTIVPGTYTQDENVVTVTRTDFTYVCPVATSSLASTSAAAVPTTVAATTTTAAPVVTSTSSASSVVASSSSTTSAATSTDAPTVLGDGQYGMTYSPYTSGGECKTKQEVLSDLKVIKGKGFNLVRVYSTDCSGLEFIGDACKELSLSIIIGVYIDGSGISAAQEQVTEISKWAEWDMVKLIVVGNEAIQSGYIDATALSSFIKTASSSFKAAGYTGVITTTEPINVWQQYGAASLCSAVDIVGANIHPFFNADVTAEKAGEFTKGEFEELEKICGGKDVINLETGWPNAGSANGAAIPGTAEQATAIKSIAKAVGSKSIFFSYSDDTWKNPGEFNVEQHWGCSGVF
ncbi:hypothetical protein N7516_008072 [Penicillium verrucosum]|uniref:uncharacterized protein n=1 Tax=Penicillium verrucosum TaxID=60171 RepID=UPI0025455497|nr:uncharacterized protein N7516_008072 [Penicillium verrucosum]KAJ5926299.1 hypothetical protein N7516_008072 [Penicillium verrucosum]